MGNVMVIPARRQVGNNIKKSEKPKLRVAAYCRVSTDSDEQAPATMPRSSIIQNIFQRIPTGRWLAYLRMTESLALTRKNVRNLTV